MTPNLTPEQRSGIAQRLRSNIPAELRSITRFVIWKYGDKPNKNGKFPKVPVHYDTLKLVDAYDPKFWLTFNHAIQQLEKHAVLSGIGFKPDARKDDIRLIDFDNCVVDGVIDPAVQQWIDRLDSYTEISPSGKGVRIVARFSDSVDLHGVNGEIYSTKNYCTLTGNVVGIPKQINDVSENLSDLLLYIDPPKPQKGDTQHTQHQHTVDAATGVLPGDAELWEIMFRAKNGDVIRRLYDGDKSGHGDDWSSADLALCNHLAFYTHNDSERIDRMFRQSQLVRNKWLRDDYRDWTIQKAIAATGTFYTPGCSSGMGSNNKKIECDDSESDDFEGEERFSSVVTNKLKNQGYSFALNVLDSTIEVNGEQLNDVAEARIFSAMRDRGFKSREAIRDVFTVMAGDNAYHPVKNYLQSQGWDGANHIAKLADHIKDVHPPIDYGNGNKQPVFRVWLGKWLIGAVAKVFSEGTTRAQPPMLVLEGGQDLGKSTFALWLGSALPDLFIESDIKPDDPEHKRYLATKWIWEVGELGSTTKKADVEALKRFITEASATFRIPYARHPVTKPALASFIGTVNNNGGFLNDPTGSRRFLCASIRRLDHSYQQSIDVNQVWAQAYALFKRGETWDLTPGEKVVRETINKSFTPEPSLLGWITAAFNVDLTDAESRCTTKEIADVLQQNGARGETRSLEMRIAEALKSLGVRQDTNARPREWIGVSRV